MAKITISPEADQDTADIIVLLTEEAGANVVRRHRRDFDGLFDRLAMFPRSGASRAHLGRPIRIGVVTPYVAVYELDDDHVLRVLDGRRNITRRLLRQ